ncbi:MAG: alkaline phosphatase family protein [Bdellovibrionota bacterium]
MNRYKSWLYLFLLINCFFIPGCRTLNSESDSKSNQTLKNTSKNLSYSDVLKKLNINLDDRMSREEFKERRVVIFYIDGLIKKVMEDMAFYGDAIEHKHKDGRRFYYTEELLEEYGISSEAILKDYWQHFKLKEGTPSTQYPERFDRYVRTQFLQLNNIRKYFIENAISYDNAYTVFPSLTVPANGSMFTGVDIDRHGIKSQAQVDRFALKEFAAGKLTDIKSISNVRFNLDSPPKNHDAILDMGIPTIYEILRDALQGNKEGQPYHFQWPILAPSLPINPSPVTKNFVLGSANKGSIDAYADVDNINFKGINLDLVKDNKVLVLWLPQVDHLSHGEDQDRMKELGLSDF